MVVMIVTNPLVKPVASVAVRAVAVPAVSFLAQRVMGDGSLFAVPKAVVSIAPAAAALVVRGGGVAADAVALDLTRVRIRLEGLHAYGVISTLMLNAALRLFSSAPKPRGPVKGERINNAARILFTISIVASVIAGAYTTVVFSLLGLYAKSAIGMGKDEACMAFIAATEPWRRGAFDTFLIALFSFMSSFVLSLFLNYEGKMRWWTSGIAAAVCLLSWCQWQSIMSVAGKLLFS